MQSIHVPPVFLMYAFRYALGRRSYAVADVAGALEANVAALRLDWRQEIVRDIDGAIREGRAGTASDEIRWAKCSEVMVRGS